MENSAHSSLRFSGEAPSTARAWGSTLQKRAFSILAALALVLGLVMPVNSPLGTAFDSVPQAQAQQQLPPLVTDNLPKPSGGPDATAVRLSQGRDACTPGQEFSASRIYIVISYQASTRATNGNRDTSQLYFQESGEGAFRTIGQPTNWVYNGLAYNHLDGYLYAISQNRPYAGGSDDPAYPPGRLLRISPNDGTVANLGRIGDIQELNLTRGTGSTTGDFRVMSNGTFDMNGDLILANNATSGTGIIYKVPFGSNGNSWAQPPMAQPANTDPAAR